MEALRPAWLFLVLGFSSQLTQVVYLRELFSTFQGTELAVAIVLAAWLLWTAAGGAAAEVSRTRRPARAFAATATALALLIPATLVPLRAMRGWLPVPRGEVPSPAWLAVVAFATLLPVCALGGAQFVFAARLTRRPARVYALECFGAAAAGALLTWLLLPRLNAVAILLLAAAACLAAALWVFGRRRILAPALLLLLVLALVASAPLDLVLQRMFWKQLHAEFELVKTRVSPYGSLAVVRYLEQHTLYRDGHPLASFPDAGESAPATHLVLLQHPHPRKVLMVGGGLTGSLEQVLQHPVERVDYVQLDPASLDLGRAFLAPEDRAALAEARVRVIHADGRGFMASAGEREYDVVFVQAPDPTTLRANRFYTKEFFRAVRRVLAEGGVFGLGHPLAPGESWAPALLEKLRQIHAALEAVFARVVVAPGPAALFLAGAGVTLDEQTLSRRMAGRLDGPAAIFGRTDPFAVTRLEREMLTGKPHDPFEQQPGPPAPPAPPNSDLRPQASFHAMLGGLEAQGDRSARLLRFARSVPWWTSLLLLGVVAVAGRALVPRRRSGGLAVAAAGLGLFAMTAQICLLMEFQALYGYLYEAIGSLFACFMVGAGIGTLGWPGLRARWLAAGGLLVGVAIALGTAAGLVLIAAAVFATGLLSGAGFGMACARSEGSAGALYAGDVLGACAGALAVPIWLLPLAGAIPTAAVAAAALAVAALLIGASPVPGQAREQGPALQ